jgi:RNA polymerase sigma-70 factor (ECF subfamily)
MHPARKSTALSEGQLSPDADPDLAQMHGQWMLLLAQDKDRDAFYGLFSYYAPRITALMMKSGAHRELAEDIAQEVLMSVWRKAPLYRAELGSVSAWIFTIARNARIDRLRRRSSQIHQDVDELELQYDAPDGEENAIASQRAEMVGAALEDLPQEQREIIEMAYIEDLPQSEIAQRLSLPLGTVKSRLRLAYGKLKIKLEVLS